MTDRLFDDAEVTVACPTCGHETEQTVGWLHTHDEAICPDCGKPFLVDSAQAIVALQECELRVGDVGRNPYAPVPIRRRPTEVLGRAG